MAFLGKENFHCVLIQFADEPRELLKQSLDSIGINIVQTVSNPNEIEDHAEMLFCHLDLLIIDDELPKQITLQILANLRSHAKYKELPALFLNKNKKTVETIRYMMRRKVMYYQGEPDAPQSLAQCIQLLQQYCAKSSPAREVSIQSTAVSLRDLVDPNALELPEDTSLQLANEVLFQSQRQYVLVGEGSSSNLTGHIYTRDDMTNLLYLGADISEMTLADLASPIPATVIETTTPESTLLLLESDAFEIVNVIDEGQKSIGVVTKQSLIDTIVNRYCLK